MLVETKFGFSSTAAEVLEGIDLQLPDTERVGLLLEDYDFFVQDPEHFCQRLQALVELRGREVVNDWIERVRAGRTPEVVLDLLLHQAKDVTVFTDQIIRRS